MQTDQRGELFVGDREQTSRRDPRHLRASSIDVLHDWWRNERKWSEKTGVVRASMCKTGVKPQLEELKGLNSSINLAGTKGTWSGRLFIDPHLLKDLAEIKENVISTICYE